jgi:flagellar hook assembly protein FlgD
MRLVGPTEIPSTFILYQNYPNPFNPSTRIEFELPDRQGCGANVLIQVFNVVGEKIKTLVSGFYAGGRYGVTWDGTNDRGQKVSSGTYYYRMISGDYVSGKKMILLK